MVLHDRRHNQAGHSIHNHFIIKALRLVRPGGLAAVLTSRYTMDARNPAARREIASLADLIGAIRLPGGAHQRAAGTDVVTDLLVLRRREPGRQPDSPAWEQTRHAELDGAQVPVNEYFLDHPEMVLGRMGAVHGAYRADDLVVRASGDTITGLSAALKALTDGARRRGLTYAPADRVTEVPSPAVAAPGGQAQPDGYLRARPDGTFTKTVYRHRAAACGAGQPGSRAAAAACAARRRAGAARGRGRLRRRQSRAQRAAGRAGPPLRQLLRRLRAAEPVRAAAHRPDQPGHRRAGSGADQAAAGRVRRRPVRPAGVRPGGIRPGRAARRQGGHLPGTGHRPPLAAARRRHPGRRAGHLPGCLR